MTHSEGVSKNTVVLFWHNMDLWNVAYHNTIWDYNRRHRDEISPPQKT